MAGMTTGNTSNLRRSEVMMKKKPMKKKTMKRDPYAEGIDPSAGRGVPLSAYNETVPKPKRKPQVSNTAAKGNKMAVKKKTMKKKGK
jgi:hypothetical protein